MLRRSGLSLCGHKTDGSPHTYMGERIKGGQAMRRGFRTERDAEIRGVLKGLAAVWAGLAVFILLVPLLVVWGSGALGREALDASDRTRNAESAAEEEQGEAGDVAAEVRSG